MDIYKKHGTLFSCLLLTSQQVTWSQKFKKGHFPRGFEIQTIDVLSVCMIDISSHVILRFINLH